MKMTVTISVFEKVGNATNKVASITPCFPNAQNNIDL